MTELEATEAIYAAVVAGMGATTLILEGEVGSPPAPTAGVPWIRLAVRDLPANPPSHGPVGGRRVQRQGVAFAQCFAPGDGVATAVTLAQSVRDLLAGDLETVVGAVTFTTGGDVRRIGRDGAWFQVNAECPFTFDATI